MDKRLLSNQECWEAALKLADHIRASRSGGLIQVFGVPRGGIPVSYLVAATGVDVSLVDEEEQANVFVDDIIASGKTMERYKKRFPRTPFLGLTDFLTCQTPRGDWTVFPWERGLDQTDESATDNIVRLLQYIGEDPNRGGLIETPQRVLKAWKEWTSGYGQDPQNVLKCFEDGGEDYNEMVIVRDLPFYSHCEHHLAPFFGTATIAYVPSKRVVGLSKIGRILNIFARRLQVQERLTTQIADALDECLNPLGVGVIVKARHLCMESRGLSTQGHHTVTSALRGVFLEERVRGEFLSIAQ